MVPLLDGSRRGAPDIGLSFRPEARGQSVEPLIFSSEVSTGDPALDAHHRALFAAANQLLFARDVTRAPGLFLRGLQFLTRWIAVHCAAEEAVLERAGDPSLARHRAAHRDVLSLAGALCRRAEDEGPSEAVRRRLYGLVHDWVRYHMVVLDRTLPPHDDAPDLPDPDLADLARNIVARDTPEAEVAERVRRCW